MLTLLCKARLATGDVPGLEEALASLERQAPDAAAAEPEMRLLMVQARVAAGRLAEALHQLVDLAKGSGDLPGPDGGPVAATFLAGLRMALPHVSPTALPSFSSAVSSFVWKATAAAPGALLGLVQALLAGHDQARG